MDFEIPDTRRQGFTIITTASALAVSIGQRITWRKERVEYWRTWRDQTQARLQSEGVTVKRALDQFDAGTYNNNISAHRGPQVVIDPEIQRALIEAEAKLKEHEDALRLYERWAKFVDCMPSDTTLPLTFADFQFFCGEA